VIVIEVRVMVAFAPPRVMALLNRPPALFLAELLLIVLLEKAKTGPLPI
jgi:hypothetical protein